MTDDDPETTSIELERISAARDALKAELSENALFK